MKRVIIIIEKLEKIDRRVIFALILIVVIIPIIHPIGMNVMVSPPVQKIYDFVNKLPEGSLIWVGFDYYNTTRTECDAQVIAFIRQAFSRNHKIFVTSTIPDGHTISQQIMDRLAKEYGKIYGKDYVILGYKPGSSVLILQVCQDLRGIYNTDAFGTPLGDIPMMKDVKNYKDINMVFTAADNQSFDNYAQIANTQYGLPVAGGSTAVMVPWLYVFYNSGQVLGILGGLKGAAEYEELIGKKETATAGMDAQSFVHVLIALMILISNIAYFLKKAANKRFAGDK